VLNKITNKLIAAFSGGSAQGEKKTMIIRLVGACFIASGLLISQALAHGGVSVQDNRCLMKIGPYEMNFTGYQPQKSYSQYCDDVPDAGRTVIVLDVQQTDSSTNIVGTANSNDLRDMAIDMRVLRNVGQASDDVDVEKNTEVYVAPKKYPQGSLHFEHDFAKGNYIGLVTATNDHGQVFVSRFPFAVGEVNTQILIIYGLAAVFLIGGIGAYFYSKRQKKAA
jgi:hypothetical protein